MTYNQEKIVEYWDKKKHTLYKKGIDIKILDFCIIYKENGNFIIDLGPNRIPVKIPMSNIESSYSMSGFVVVELKDKQIIFTKKGRKTIPKSTLIKYYWYTLEVNCNILVLFDKTRKKLRLMNSEGKVKDITKLVSVYLFEDIALFDNKHRKNGYELYVGLCERMYIYGSNNFIKGLEISKDLDVRVVDG